MLTSPRVNPKPSLMNTSKRAAVTEAARAALVPNLPSNAHDLKTGHGMAEGTPGIEVMMTVVVTDEVVAVEAPINVSGADRIMEEEDTAVGVEEVTMTGGIIVVEEGEVLYRTTFLRPIISMPQIFRSTCQQNKYTVRC